MCRHYGDGAVNRVAIIGNAGGGKSTLSRMLGNAFDLPVYHVDSIQYQSDWKRTPSAECDGQLDQLAAMERWIIDGFGSDLVIERRLQLADTVIFVDFSLAVHYWWALKRQWRSRLRQRPELPDGCPEFTLSYTRKLVAVMWRVHADYRPWFRDLIERLPANIVVFHLRSPREWQRFAKQHCRTPPETGR